MKAVLRAVRVGGGGVGGGDGAGAQRTPGAALLERQEEEEKGTKGERKSVSINFEYQFRSACCKRVLKRRPYTRSEV